jgi:hypothetical protein
VWPFGRGSVIIGGKDGDLYVSGSSYFGFFWLARVMLSGLFQVLSVWFWFCPYVFYVLCFVISICVWKSGVRFCRLSSWLGVV